MQFPESSKESIFDTAILFKSYIAILSFMEGCMRKGIGRFGKESQNDQYKKYSITEDPQSGCKQNSEAFMAYI